MLRNAEKWLTKGRMDKELVVNHPQLLDFIIHLKVSKNTILIQGDTVLPNVIRYVITNDGMPLSKLMPPKGIEGQFKRANKLTDEFFDSVMSEIGYDVWDKRIHTINKSVYAERRSDINKGYKATLVTDLSEFVNLGINYAFYINETNKITENFLIK